jgi:hypothetical protein
MEPERDDPVSLGQDDEFDEEDAPGDSVQEADEESFPASDPPAQWAG